MNLLTVRQYCAIGMLSLIAACKSDSEKFADKQYEIFKTETFDDSLSASAGTSAEFVAQFHYDSTKKAEARKWLVDYNKKMDAYRIEEKKEKDSIEQIVNRLGGYKLIEIDTKAKCNLYRGYYQLNKTIKDSADLAFIAKYLANKLFQQGPTKEKCPNMLMSQAFIYQPKFCDRSKWASLCTISPVDHYVGEVTVNK